MITRELVNSVLEDALDELYDTEQMCLNYKNSLYKMATRLIKRADSSGLANTINLKYAEAIKTLDEYGEDYDSADYRDVLRLFAKIVARLSGIPTLDEDAPVITESDQTLTDEQLTAFVAYIIHDMIPHLPFVTGQKIAETHVHEFRKNPGKYSFLPKY